MHLESETELLGVKLDRRIDVIDDAPYLNRGHSVSPANFAHHPSPFGNLDVRAISSANVARSAPTREGSSQ